MEFLIRIGTRTEVYGLRTMMTNHLDKERSSKIADEAALLTAEELEHLEHCSDCVEAIAQRIRERLQMEKPARAS